MEAYGVDASHLSATLPLKEQWALLKSNDGVLHKASRESYRFFMENTQISTDSITIEQLLPDGAGCGKGKQQ